MKLDAAWLELLSGLGDAAILADEAGLIVFANPAAEQLLGWSEGQLAGQHLNAIQPDRLHEPHNRAYASFVARGKLEQLANKAVRLPARKRNGDEIDIELTLSTIRQDGHLLVIGLMRDLSERVELERQLQMIEQLHVATAIASDLSLIANMDQLLAAIVSQLITRFDFAAVGVWLQTSNGILRAEQGAPMPELSNEKLSAMCDIEHVRLLTDKDDWLASPTAFGALLPLCSEEQRDGMIAVFARDPISPEFIEVLNTLSSLLNSNIGNIAKFERERIARLQAEQAQADLAFLDHASEQLISSTELGERMQQLVSLSVPMLGNWAAVYRVNDLENEELNLKNVRLTHCYHTHPEEASLLRRTLSREGAKKLLQLDRLGKQLRPVVVSLSPDRFGVASVLLLPMRARERLAAILVIGNTSPSFTEQQMRIGDELARHAALATDNIRLWEEHQKTSAARAESAGMFKAFFEAAPVARGFLDRKLRLVNANDSLHALLGLEGPLDLAHPRPLVELLPSLSEAQLKMVRGVVREGKPVADIEVTSGNEAESPHYWLMHAYPVWVAEQLRGVGLSFTNITDRKAAEKDLAASERRFRAVLEAAPNAIIAIDTDGLMTYANPQAEIAFGYEQFELIGAQVEMLLPTRVHDLHRSHRAGFFEHPNPRPMGVGRELAGRRKDGSEFPVEISLSPVDTPNGLQVFATVVDITARKQFEVDLRHSRDQLAAILSGVADGIIVQDRRGRVVFANPAALRALGYQELRELQSLSISQLSEHFELLDEYGKRVPLWRLPSYDVLRGKESPERLIHFRSRQQIRDRWFWVRASGVRDGQGRLDLIINIFRDVSEARKTTERSEFLAASSSLMAESLDYADTLQRVVQAAVPQLADWCVVDVLDEDQDYTSQPKRLAVAHIDPAKIQLAQELEKETPYDPHAPQGLGAVLRTGNPELIEDIPPALLEAAMAGRSDEYRELIKALQLRSYICVPMRSQGRILGALTFVYAESGRHYDQEDLRLAEEVASRAAMAIENARLYQRAQASIREREDFLAVASHELRTPVTVVRAYSQSLLRWLEHSPQAKEVNVDRQRLMHGLRNINEGTTRLTALIEQLLDITSLQAQEERLELASVNLEELLQMVVEDARLLQGQGRYADLTIDLAVDDEIHGLWDASRLQRVFTNLLDNALKYSPAREAVSIRAWSEDSSNSDSKVHITFKDNGLGVPSSEHYSIFEPFKRASNASTRNYSGFGMGLAVSRQIVDLHGGRVWVESRGNELGSIFHIVLPRLAPEA